MKIGIISDHRGFELKKKIIEYYNKEINFIDYGTNSKESADYPDFAFKLGNAISDKKVDLGIAICSSGIGMSIACNKVKGVRCARVTSIKDVKVTRNDNNTNVIAFSSSLNFNKILRMIDEFINTPFSDEERHNKRVNKIIEYELTH